MSEVYKVINIKLKRSELTNEHKLYDAIVSQDYKTAKVLIPKIADLNNIYIKPYLGLCATYNNLPIAKLLVEAGADINIYDNNKNTPLMLGCLGTGCYVVDYLIKIGANPWLENNEGKNALTLVMDIVNEQINLDQDCCFIPQRDNRLFCNAKLIFNAMYKGYKKKIVETGVIRLRK